MKLANKNFLARSVCLGLVLSAAGWGVQGLAHRKDASALTPDVNGPAADYPVTIGAQHQVQGVSYTPSDEWNYDQVGYVALDPAGGASVTGENHTLPVPSYVEVTSLETGKTILVRIERRGPMDNNSLIGLSPGAAAQLGAVAGTPVRVRRVNPPEPERAALRSGKAASERMATPMSLVAVLKRKLPGGDVQKSTDLAAAPAKPTALPPASVMQSGPGAAAPSPVGDEGQAGDSAEFDGAFNSPAAATPAPAPTPAG